jgi:hypothetical protein
VIYFSKTRFPNYFHRDGRYYHALGGTLEVEVKPLQPDPDPESDGGRYLPMVDRVTDTFVRVPLHQLRVGRPEKVE